MIVSRGFIYMKTNKKLIKDLSLEIKQKVQNYLLTNEKLNKSCLKKYLIDFVSSKIYDLTIRKPIIIPIILSI